ncbi:keratin, type I cytoskeletal 14-like [Lucilia cuprina]|uniref:keratin, type I cytoskeletal 14-like n=1 Tax=Lucilia cuprina TaxID=7375 RepID=UPI001F06441D|nr:keratin, type I cytoskeletal 14-like [Lucilia cuprina]
MKLISTLFVPALIVVLVAYNPSTEAKALLGLFGGSSSGGSTSLLGGVPLVGGLLGGSGTTSGGLVGGLPVVGGVLGGSTGSSVGGNLLGGLPLVGGLVGGSTSTSGGGLLGGLGGGLLGGVVQTVGNTVGNLAGTALNVVGTAANLVGNTLAAALNLVTVIPATALNILTGTLGSALDLSGNSPISIVSSLGTVLGDSFGGNAPAGIQSTVIAQGSEIDSLLAILYNAVQLKNELEEKLKTAVGAEKDALMVKYNQQVAIITDLEERLTQKSSGLKLLIDSANNVAAQLPKVTLLESQVADLKAQLAAASGAQKEQITITLNAQETALDKKYSDLLNQLKAFIESGLDNCIKTIQTTGPYLPADMMSLLSNKLNTITSNLNSAFGEQIPNLGGLIPDLDGLKATLVALAQNLPAQLSQVSDLINTIAGLSQKFPTATPEEQAAISAAYQQSMAALNDNLSAVLGTSSSIKGFVYLAKLISARLSDVNALKQQLTTASADQKAQIAAQLDQRQKELNAIISKMLQLTQTVANDNTGTISMNTINILNNGLSPLLSLAKVGFETVLNTAGAAAGLAAGIVNGAANLVSNAAGTVVNGAANLVNTAAGTLVNGFNGFTSGLTGNIVPGSNMYISGSASPTVTYTSSMIPDSSFWY